MTQFYLTVYTSKSIGPITDDLLNDILFKSRINNSLHSLTGCLIARNNFFFQLLEGPEEEVRRCLNKIEKDPRHINITIQGEAFTNERLMPDWSMGFIQKDGHKLNSAEEMLHLFDLGRDGQIYSSSQSLKLLFKIFSRGMKVLDENS